MASQIDFDKRLSNVPSRWHNDRLHFFKYMSESTARIVLENQTLRWSTASMLNDPFDMQFDMSIRANLERTKKAALKKQWNLYKGNRPIPAGNPLGEALELLRRHPSKMSRKEFTAEFSAAIQEGFERMVAHLPKTHAELAPLLADIKVLSLTTRPDFGLMWSHYANSHKGVVFRFRSCPHLDSPYGMAKPMNYVKEVPSMFDEDLLIDIFAGLAGVNTREFHDKIVYTKSEEWAYEKEWRISPGSGRDKDAQSEDIPYGSEELDGIIFGLKTSDADKSVIKTFAEKYPNIELMQATRNQSSFELSIEPY